MELPHASSGTDTGSILEVLRVFFRLGLTCFGGPVAHLGYFRDEFVRRRRWLDEAAFADLLALCQFLPGPASSQLGFAIGLRRAGFGGALAAWTGFTLPSAVAMVVFASAAQAAAGPVAEGVIHGLKLVAVAIVAQAVWGMTRTLCPDLPRTVIGLAALVLSVVLTHWRGPATPQVLVLAGGALAGYGMCKPARARTTPVGATRAALPRISVSRRAAWLALGAYGGLLLGVPLLRGSALGSLFDAFYAAGALVFGGGHVILPLLSEAFVTTGLVSPTAFLAGYGAAQALPGPLFTFAAYLGAEALPAHPLGGATLGLCGIFLPGMLILVAALPFWEQLRARRGAAAAMRGVNASVVGLLAAALYDPICTSAVADMADGVVALTGFILLTAWRIAPLWVVLGAAAAGAALRYS